MLTMVDQLSARPGQESRKALEDKSDGPNAASDLRPANLLAALWRGISGHCPACGCTRLFRAFLKPVPTCLACGEDLQALPSDDFPPYIVILLLGHLLAPGMIILETWLHPPVWVQLVIWLPLAVILGGMLIQPVKGGVIALLWWHGPRLNKRPGGGEAEPIRGGVENEHDRVRLRKRS